MKNINVRDNTKYDFTVVSMMLEIIVGDIKPFILQCHNFVLSWSKVIFVITILNYELPIYTLRQK